MPERASVTVFTAANVTVKLAYAILATLDCSLNFFLCLARLIRSPDEFLFPVALALLITGLIAHPMLFEFWVCVYVFSAILERFHEHIRILRIVFEALVDWIDQDQSQFGITLEFGDGIVQYAHSDLRLWCSSLLAHLIEQPLDVH